MSLFANITLFCVVFLYVFMESTAEPGGQSQEISQKFFAACIMSGTNDNALNNFRPIGSTVHSKTDTDKSKAISYFQDLSGNTEQLVSNDTTNNNINTNKIKLINKIKEVKAQIKHYENTNLQLESKLKEEGNKTQNELETLLQLVNIYDSRTETKTTKLQELQANLADKYGEDASLLREIEVESEVYLELDLKTSLLKQDIDLLKSRRDNGQFEKCRSFGFRQLSTPKQELDKIHVLDVILKRLVTSLAHVKAHNMQLNKELTNKLQLYSQIKNDFHIKIDESRQNLELIANETNYFQNKLNHIIKDIDNLKLKLGTLQKDNENYRTVVKNLELMLEDYKEDLLCYRQLTMETCTSKEISDNCALTSSFSLVLC